MERKYYLRGLGLGIAVTAVIMGIALSGNQSMTNEEIIARAKELGLVENTVLLDTESADDSQTNNVGQNIEDGTKDVAVNEQNNPTAADIETDSENDTDGDSANDDAEYADESDQGTGSESESKEQGADDGTEPVADEAGGGEMQEDGDYLTADDAEAEDDNEAVTPVTIKVITINSGDGSYTVAKKLEDVGVVSSAATFDTFLCQNGYDKRLRTGNFSIPTDASDEQIARIVTGLE